MCIYNIRDHTDWRECVVVVHMYIYDHHWHRGVTVKELLRDWYVVTPGQEEQENCVSYILSIYLFKHVVGIVFIEYEYFPAFPRHDCLIFDRIISSQKYDCLKCSINVNMAHISYQHSCNEALLQKSFFFFNFWNLDQFMRKNKPQIFEVLNHMGGL